MATIDKAIHAADQLKRNEAGGQDDLFGEMPVADEQDDALGLEYVETSPWTPIVRLQAEKDTLGRYISGHPFQVYYRETQHFTSAMIGELPRHLGRETTIAGIITTQRRIVTKSGRKMAILAIEDHTGSTEVTVFSRLLAVSHESLVTDSVIIVKAKVEKDKFSGGVRCVAEKINPLMGMRETRARRLLLTFDHEHQVDEIVTQLPTLMKPYCGGKCDVVIAYGLGHAKVDIQLGQGWRVHPENALIEQLGECCGHGAVTLEY